jgi:ABC-2 type transport system ATP-binding protein
LGPLQLSIHPGEIWGLVGENGNGKTTLLRILANDLTYDSGEMKFAMQEEKGDEYELRTKLVYLPQRTPKWYGSLKENLKFAATNYGTKGDENELLVMMYIIRFGLWPFRNHMWSELSSGYKMRFELARTFLRKPSLLLLDEPLANLDVLAQQLILEDLKSLSQSLAQPIGIVLSSQQLFEVEKVSDKVIFLKNGFPTHLSDAISESQENKVLIELDAKIEKIELQQLLSELNVEKLSYNGGVFVIELLEENAVEKLLTVLLKNKIQLTYFRDITNSSRRLFN